MKSGISSGIHPGIHKRLYSALPRPSSSQHPRRPRPRSNSASLHTTNHLLPLSFFDSPASAPSSSRLPSTQPRIPGEPKQQTNHPNPLALTPSPLADDGTSPNNQLLFSNIPRLYLNHSTHDLHANSSTIYSKHKRSRTRYQLDVGAYGIPKRSCHSPRPFHSGSETSESLNLAVQVGEDAYFIRDNAIGVADGVGGWARLHPSDPNLPSTPSPSALFARRLMHFTSAQLGSPDSPLIDQDAVPDLDHAHSPEGIDVLQILESAYEQTLKAHVQPSTSTPLHTGSSTALVAVLDNVDEPVLKIAHIGDCMGMLVRGDNVVWRSEEMWWAFNTPVQLSPPPISPTPKPSPSLPVISYSPLQHVSPSLAPRKPTSSLSPSHHIHLPVRSVPSTLHSSEPSVRADTSRVTPRNAAHIITLPVHADDILILASDGLSDNLWDEDVLDEVVRFRRTWSTSTDKGGDIDGHGTTEEASGIQDTAPTVDDPQPTMYPITSIQRYALAGMLSEALCSRAHRVSAKRPAATVQPLSSCSAVVETPSRFMHDSVGSESGIMDDTPFARRARELGKSFAGGKRDDISVLVAIVSSTVC